MMNPIRILQVFARMDRGGAETMIMNIYRNIDRNKIQFDFIVHTDEECHYEAEIKDLGGRIYRLPVFSGKNLFAYKRAWQDFIITNGEYRVIHGHVRSTASIYLKIAKKHGLITIAHSHSTSSGVGISAYVKNILQYPIRYIADYLFACSKQAGAWLYGEKATKKDNFFVINNAIDSEKYIYDHLKRSKIREKYSIEKNFVIGHIGRFNYPKNHEFIIDVFKAVYDRNKNVVLLLVGDGNLRPQIEQKINNFGLNNNVILTGIIEDIPEILQGMDLFLFPSLYEGLPVSLVEAQVSGLKCIVSDTVTNEVVFTNNLVTFMSLKEQVNAWADKILTYYAGYERIDCQSKIIKSKFDIKQTCMQIQDFYLSQIN